jgi:hypothetical protein
VRRFGPVLATGLIVASAIGAACTLPGGGCDVTIAAIDDGEDIEIETLPADAEVLVRPGDVDPNGWMLTEDPDVGLVAELRLRPAAAERFAQHTRDHIGDFIALEVDGVVVAVPSILSPIEDGRLQVSFPDADDGAREAIQACLPVELAPPG